jgi:DNA repair exonuclease SbcCD nuclease subunit
MRFIHTSDWQVGKVFRMFDREIEAVLQNERLEVIARLGALALAHDAVAILVAGDVWDHAEPSDRTLAQPLERMRSFSTVEWHLTPGNHDPHQPGGAWESLQERGLPPNVKLHLRPEPAPIGDGKAWVLPAPLSRRHIIGDPTQAMDEMNTPSGALRIGLAHGSIIDFGTDGLTTHNRIAPDRTERAHLDYLALGDWHAPRQIDEKTWYSGTPEPDSFAEDANGKALLVELTGTGRPPLVTPLDTGKYRWVQHATTIHDEQDIRALADRLRRLDSTLDRLLVELRVTGTLSVAARATFDAEITRGVGPALFALRLDDAGLVLAPTEEDLDAIDHAGFVRTAADRLRQQATDQTDPRRDAAALALRELWTLHARTTDV